MSTGNASVDCSRIRLAYGTTEVLRDVSIDVAPGEFFALLGPSGSGKSTLLRLIAGFVAAQGGEVRIDGRDVSRLAPWERQVGMVFQSYALWPHLSVFDNVAFGLVERKVAKREIAARVGAALELVGLQAYGERRPSQLSGGQQQRVALARTIVVEPRVLLLDEPLSNLDKLLRVQMRQELLALQRRLRLTTIFVTHDQEEAMTTADRMAVLDQGVLQQVGTPAELYDRPANAFVAGFVGTMNLVPAAWLDPVAVGTAGFRPHAARLAAPGDATRDPALAWIEGELATVEFLGGTVRHHVAAGGRSIAVDEVHDAARPRRTAGERIAVGIERRQAHRFEGDGRI